MALYLPMEGGATAALNDYSGNSIVATAHGDPVWLPTGGHDGHGAWEFDGSGDDLNCGENFPTGSSYTKTAWVYRTGSGANGGNNIISGDANSGGHAMWAPDGYGNKLSAGHNGTWNSVQDDVALALNTWFFVSLTYDEGTDKMVLYKNGIAIDSATVSVSVTDATISIASFGASNGYMLQGRIDDARVWNRVLSGEQIHSLYANGADVVKSTETVLGDHWQAEVTAFTAGEVGSTALTDVLTIVDIVPTPPVIVSIPDTTALTGELYSYNVDATGSPAPAYGLLANPAGMTINSGSGLIEWTPSLAESAFVEVRAFNSEGADTQAYWIEVTTPVVPGVENVVLTSTSGHDDPTDDITSSYDFNGDAVTAATAWYSGSTGSPLDPLMAFYLPMEGGATAALNDYSGNSIVATTNGNPVWLPTGGHDGHGAWEFDGTGDDLDGGENFPTNSSYTKTAWVYWTGSGENGGNNIIAGDQNSGGHALWAADMFSNHLSAGHNGTWNSVEDDVALAQNTWVFVSLSYDDATDKMVLYKNGVAIDSATVSTPVTDPTISIGSFGASNGWMIQGRIDDPRVWNARSPANRSFRCIQPARML